MRLNVWRGRRGKPLFPEGRVCLGTPGFVGTWVLLILSSLLGPATALAQPANDRFTNAKSLSGVLGSISGTTLNATNQVGEPAHAGSDASHSIWYRWTAPPFVGRAYFSTEGSQFDTVLAAYTGKDLLSLVQVASNNDERQGVAHSFIQFATIPGTTYWIAIDGVDESMGLTELSWSTRPGNDDFAGFRVVTNPVGSIRGNSSGAQLEIGEEPPLALDATGTVWFAWAATVSGDVTFDTIGSAFNTVLVIYEGNSLDELGYVTGDDDGGGEDGTSKITFNVIAGQRFRIVVAGREGATGEYQLNWTQEIPPPFNDHFAGATEIRGFTGQINGANFGATEEAEEPQHGVQSTRGSVWYSWEAPRAGAVGFTLADPSASMLVSVYRGVELGNLVRVATTDQNPGPIASFVAIEGEHYQIAVDGDRGAFGSFRLQWTYADLTSPYDLFRNAKVLVGFRGTSTTENYYATLENAEPFNAGDPGGKSVWFKWKSPADFRVTLDTAGSNFDTLLSVYTGTDLESGLAKVAANDDADGRTTSSLRFDAEANQVYYFSVDGSSLQNTQPAEIGMVVLSFEQALHESVLVSPSRGWVGTRLRIGIGDFNGVSSVTIGGVEAEFAPAEGCLVAVVPSGALTGPIVLKNQDGEMRSSLDDFVVLAGQPPVLSVRKTGVRTVELAWSAEFPDFLAQTTTNPTSDEAWIPLGPGVKVGGRWLLSAEVEVGTKLRCFRLVLP